MSAAVLNFNPEIRAAQQRLERDMVVEVCRRIAEAFNDVAELGGVSVQELRDLVARAEAEVLHD